MDDQTNGQSSCEQLANAIKKRGWQSIAAIALSIAAPFGPFLSQVALLAEPLAPRPWCPLLRKWHRVLENPMEIERLIAALDESFADIKEDRCHPLSS